MKWTYEKCKEESSKFNTKNEFRKQFPGAYRVIGNNKWFELYNHMKLIGNKYNRLIYVYEFPDNHCYIGLTGNIYQ